METPMARTAGLRHPGAGTGATAFASRHPLAFPLALTAWSLGLFSLLRLPWVTAHILLPITQWQGQAGAALIGPSSVPVEVTLACSGADALALCAAAIAAYPSRWRMRLLGIGGGTALILTLNTIRIGTLGRAAASPGWFDALHVYVWPAALTLAIAGYVFAWIRLADRPHEPVRAKDAPGGPLAPPQSWRRFALFTCVLLLLFSATSPLYLQSATVLAVARFVTMAAAWILAGAGVDVLASGNVLWTAHNGFRVTQECLVTPLIPVYLAAVATYAPTRRTLVAGALAAAPIFVLLGIVRLFLVALPEVLASPMFMVHAFYQLVLGAGVVFGAAVWRHGRARGVSRAFAGVVLATVFVYSVGHWLNLLVAYPVTARLDDPQGAVALLPAFQLALYVAVWVAAFSTAGWWRFLAGLGVLVLSQTAVLLLLQALQTHAGVTAHVRDVRGWAVAGPLLMVAVVVNGARPRR
jgi:exosortase/archaeosortase family protein